MPTAKLCVTFLVLASVLPAASENVSPRPSLQRSTEEGLRLLHTMQESLGGADNIAAVHDFDETIHDVRGYAVTAPKPNVLRIEHDGSADDVTLDPDDGWRTISGVRFPTHRVNFHSGLKRGEVTTETIHVNIGLRRQELAATPANFAPDIPHR